MGNMSQASPEALRQIAETLRRNIDRMEGAKSQMDQELNKIYGTQWQDPVADAYKEKYERSFNAIRNELLKNMAHYSQILDLKAIQIQNVLDSRSRLEGL